VTKILNLPEEDHPSKFATSFSAGLIYKVSGSIGIQLQGRILQLYSKLPGDYVVNSWSQVSRRGTVVTQGAVTGGLVFCFGK